MGRLAADYDLAPAETVLESVALLGGSECDVASWLGMGLGTPEWKSFRDGESPLTPAMAVALHRHLGAPVGFWLDLEHRWRRWKAEECFCMRCGYAFPRSVTPHVMRMRAECGIPLRCPVCSRDEPPPSDKPPELCFETEEERDEPMSPLEMPPPMRWWDRLRKWLGVS